MADTPSGLSVTQLEKKTKQNKKNYVRSEVFTAVTMKNGVGW
jgi:hypothetical protein